MSQSCRDPRELSSNYVPEASETRAQGLIIMAAEVALYFALEVEIVKGLPIFFLPATD